MTPEFEKFAEEIDNTLSGRLQGDGRNRFETIHRILSRLFAEIEKEAKVHCSRCNEPGAEEIEASFLELKSRFGLGGAE